MKAFKWTKTVAIAILITVLLTGCGIIGGGQDTGDAETAAESAQIESANAENQTIAASRQSEEQQTTDSEIIHDMITECVKANLKSSRCGWLHYQTLREKFADISDNNVIDNPDEMTAQLTDNDIAFITNILVSTEYEVLDRRAETNTGFFILLEYDTGCNYEIRLSDSEVYMNISKDDEYIYYTKVLNFTLYEYIFRFADKNIDGFPVDIFNNIESVKINYVRDEDKEEFNKTGKITEIEITDSETLDKIKLAFREDIEVIDSNRMAGDADIILRTTDGREYYGKITFPVDEESNDSTIVMQGYFWYECAELYEILAEIED